MSARPPPRGRRRGRAPRRPTRSAAAAPPPPRPCRPARAGGSRPTAGRAPRAPRRCDGALEVGLELGEVLPCRRRPAPPGLRARSARRRSGSPWVSEASTNPPLRPLAPQPAVSASRTTTSRSGCSRLASSAAHKPVKPPPTIARSASAGPSRGAASAGRGRSSQNGVGRRRAAGRQRTLPEAPGDISFDTAALVFGGLLIFGALASGRSGPAQLPVADRAVRARRLPAGGGRPRGARFDPGSGFVGRSRSVALIVILFRDGLEVEAEMLQTPGGSRCASSSSPCRSRAGIVACASRSSTDLSWTEAFLLGALLSPTDPVLSSSVVTNPRVPRVVRHSLNLESGLNDGLALPAVLASAPRSARASPTSRGGSSCFRTSVLGFAFGGRVRAGPRRAAPAGKRSSRRRSPRRTSRSLYALGVAFATYGVTVAEPHGNGFIAVFVCAITLGIRRPDIPLVLRAALRGHRRDGQARDLRRVRLAADDRHPVRGRLAAVGDRRRHAPARAHHRGL